MNMLINTGIIGFGLSGKVFHTPFIHTHPAFHLSAIVERNRKDSQKTYPDIRVYQDHHELLADKSIDLIVVATPNIHHYSMVKESLLTGKHVIVEKPFVPSSSEADELIILSEKTAKKIFVYQNRRWDGDFLTIQKLISENRLGAISHYEAHFDRFSPALKPNAWRDKDIPGGGILFDLGAHLIDQVLVLFGLPQKIKAVIQSERPGSIVDDCFALSMYYPEKTVLLKAGMLVEKEGPRFIIKGQKGTFTKYGIDPQEAALKKGELPHGDNWGSDDAAHFGTIKTEKTSSPVPTEKGNYMGFYDNVYDVLFKNKPQAVSPEEGRDVIFIIEKAFESNRQGKIIEIK